MKKMTVYALTVLASFATSSAFAAEKPTPPAGPAPGKSQKPHMFIETDADKDGVISKEEWTANGDKKFGEIDANKDGKITQDETKAHFEAKRAEWEKRKAQAGKPDGKPADAPKPAEKN